MGAPGGRLPAEPVHVGEALYTCLMCVLCAVLPDSAWRGGRSLASMCVLLGITCTTTCTVCCNRVHACAAVGCALRWSRLSQRQRQHGQVAHMHGSVPTHAVQFSNSFSPLSGSATAHPRN